MNLTPPASVLGRRYLPAIEDFCAFIARAAAGHPLIAPLLGLLGLRLRRTLGRIDRLVLRWQRGRHHPRKSRPRATARPPIPHTPEQPRRTPRARAWLIRLHPPMAQFAPSISLLLEDADTIALCAAAPQARRLLRPLARMFGLTLPAHLAPPPRAPKPRKPRQPRPKPPPFAEHSAAAWPFVPYRLRLRVPGLPRPGRAPPRTS